MADYVPVYDGGAVPQSKTASAAVVGGTLVEATTAGSVGPAGAASTKIEGVAAFDAGIGARVAVWPLNNVEHEIAVVAAGTITVGDGVQSAAAGLVATATVATAAAAGTLIGTATSTATAPNKVRFIGRG
jgi:hypothetical protein